MDDYRWLSAAVGLSRQCPPSPSAFSVGAIVVIGDEPIAQGFSRRDDPVDHAEEAALRDSVDRDVSEATIYTSLEPCGNRASRPRPCAQLILDAGIRRVVYAWSEPNTFVDSPSGAQLLSSHGIEVVHLADLADDARAVNAHLFGEH